MPYKGKVVVVTGAGKGIGWTIAITYAKHGAKVVIIDKDVSAINLTSDLIQNEGYEVLSYVLDLSKPKEIEITILRANNLGEIQKSHCQLAVIKKKSIWSSIRREQYKNPSYCLHHSKTFHFSKKLLYLLP